MPEERRRQTRMYLFQQLNDWLQKHERGAFWIDDQVERSFRPSLIRVVNQPVAECEI